MTNERVIKILDNHEKSLEDQSKINKIFMESLQAFSKVADANANCVTTLSNQINALSTFVSLLSEAIERLEEKVPKSGVGG